MEKSLHESDTVKFTLYQLMIESQIRVDSDFRSATHGGLRLLQSKFPFHPEYDEKQSNYLSAEAGALQ